MHGKNAALIRKYYPNYQSPKRVYERLLEATVTPDTVWLDVGCGRRLTGNNELNQSLAQRARFIVGCDRDPHLKRHETVRHLVLCDAAALPFRNETFNLVTASMVAEHLEYPERVFAEVARISAPGGRFIVFTPNKWNYAMVVARLTPHWFHVAYKRLTHFINRREWRSFEDEVFPTGTVPIPCPHCAHSRTVPDSKRSRSHGTGWRILSASSDRCMSCLCCSRGLSIDHFWRHSKQTFRRFSKNLLRQLPGPAYKPQQ